MKRQYMTIGEVVDRLKHTNSDISISKVRYLEEEGLISPERTAGGYRKFSPADVSRIELILKMQRDLFMPLAVIREKLSDYDKGNMPDEMRQVVGVYQPMALPLDEAVTVPLEDAPSTLGLPISYINELEGYGLIKFINGENGLELSRTDVQISHICWDMRRFGVEPRHLRMYETFAERETAFFSQILMPAFRHRTPESRQKLLESLDEIIDLSERLTSQLVRRSLGRIFEDVV